MAALSAPRLYTDGRLGIVVYTQTYVLGKSCFHRQPSILGSFPARALQICVGSNSSKRRLPLDTCVKCKKKEEPVELNEITVEFPPYHVYMDSTSGQLEPASGARSSIPDQDYWPEGTADRVRAARAPEPTGESKGSPSFGKSPGSRRKNYKTAAVAQGSSEVTKTSNEMLGIEASDDNRKDANDISSDYVVYETEPEEEETGYELDKKLGRPHSFVDPKVRRTIEKTLPNEDLWWNWRRADHPKSSRWQRRKPDVETVFLKAMAESGQVKLYGKEPTVTETALYRARRHLFKEERRISKLALVNSTNVGITLKIWAMLQAEQERHEKVGSLQYYSEWVKAWKRDTSREAVQKHFEETGEDENTQLIEMFCHQTDREFRVMMGTDVRIRRDPLAMRMREDQIKQIWGGDPVYPTINYIQDPNETVDYRGADFQEPTNLLSHLMEEGKIISREELKNILAKEKKEQVEITDIDDAMAKAVDIGENDEEGEDSDAEDEEQGEEKLPRNWSVLKSTPELRKSKPKPNKDDPMSLEEAIGDSENLTDFLMDFQEEEE